MARNGVRFISARALPITAVLLSAMAASPSRASDLVEVLPLTKDVLMLHFDDGYVQHHKRGEPRSQETVITNPLNVQIASQSATYKISSLDDAAYKQVQSPTDVGRKTKGTDFAWFVDRWENNRAVNDRPDHTAEHWLYLRLPSPLQSGRTYTLSTGSLAKNGNAHKIKFDTARLRSEAVHVNTLGYVPNAPTKYAYVYHWMGDKGALDLSAVAGKAFHIVDFTTRKRLWSGKVAFRKAKSNPETFNVTDSPPYGNFLNADVWECDFSGFRVPGRYVVEVEGVGSSWPFRITADVYRPAFRAVARALYHNRSGIALTKPYTEFERPAPHNPKLTPGFKGNLRYSRVRWSEWGSEGGDPKVLMDNSPGTLDETWGWYQDAGDWDGYPSHLRVPQELLLSFEMGRNRFSDGELNIPESGNKVPDILDEAAWLPRYFQRLRAELLAKKWGTGGVGGRVAGDAFGGDEKKLPDGKTVGQGSWEDVDRVYMVSGEDPWTSYRYAGTAAHLAHLLRAAGIARDPQGVDWTKEARESYAWAQKNTRDGDEAKENLRNPRAYAAAALFRLTGEKPYEAQFIRDTEWIKADTLVREDASYGPFIYALDGGKGQRDEVALKRVRDAILFSADEDVLNSSAKRALRWGGDFGFPMLIGHQTTPWVLGGVAAYTLTRQSEPARAKRYLGALYTTADYFMGTNALNQTWITGVGPRYPQQIFHMDAWYNGKGQFHAGLIPYSPWRKQKESGQGPWDSDWANKTLYPAIDAWPGNERWFSNRNAPLANEFTVHQNIGPAAAFYGWLCGEQPKSSR
ncbi:MAG TPA: glycoside hydrolase family 9 protein [Abditibacteriaceae bacterium]|nr:glycoside hydrolase family 9 protein [Abditibacteriaceae bacterium]